MVGKMVTDQDITNDRSRDNRLQDTGMVTPLYGTENMFFLNRWQTLF